MSRIPRGGWVTCDLECCARLPGGGLPGGVLAATKTPAITQNDAHPRRRITYNPITNTFLPRPCPLFLNKNTPPPDAEESGATPA
jgi:hypothetical protein